MSRKKGEELKRPGYQNEGHPQRLVCLCFTHRCNPVDPGIYAKGTLRAETRATASVICYFSFAMRDPEIRNSLRQFLHSEYASDPTALILDEFGLCGGEVRADVVVINGNMKGYEIKSDFDSVDRLGKQSVFYGKVFDTATMVVGHRQIKRVWKIVPSW